MTEAYEGEQFTPVSNGGDKPVFGDPMIRHTDESGVERTLFIPRGASQSPASSTSAPTNAAPDIFTAAGTVAPLNVPLSLNEVADAGFGDAVSAGIDSTGRRRGHVALIVIIAVFLALLVCAVGGFFTARWYFQDKAAPGVTFAGAGVAGKNSQQLSVLVSDAVAKSTVTVSDGNGRTVNATLKDLGVTVDVQQTVRNLLAAKSGNDVARVNPFSRANVGLATTTDQLALSNYLTGQFVTRNDRAMASNITYNATSGNFTVVPGKDGRAPTASSVGAAVDTLIAKPGTAVKASIQYQNVQMPITVAAAQKVADQANQRVASPITFKNGNAATFTIPASQVASWITTTVDPSKGTIALAYDQQAISSYLTKELPLHLNQTMVSQQDVVDKNGTVLVTTVPGVDGVAIKNTGAVPNQVFNALNNGQPANITVQADVTKFDVKKTQADTRIVVDRAKQTATVYDKNNNVLKVFNVCTGRPGSDETNLGTYFIYLRYDTQDMRGLNDNGTPYLSPGVKWVSYFNGGEGFHTALWNYSGIARGDPTNNGSHGCVNMYEQDAKWIFDHCPKGTVVQVVGAQPTGPVR